MTPQEQNIPYGYCKCGCGGKVNPYKKNDPKRGKMKGQLSDFLPSHFKKIPPPEFTSIADNKDVFMKRFLRKVRKTDSCWIWTASKQNPRRSQPINYGVMVVRAHPRYAMLAHRISWELHYGPVPEELRVLHKCDNPPCVNPAHLFLGTQKENMDDCVEKGRKEHGEKHYRAKFTERDVSDIRRRYAQGETIPKLSMAYDRPHGTVWAVVRCKTWRYLESQNKPA